MSEKITRPGRGGKRTKSGQYMIYLNEEDRAVLDEVSRIEDLHRSQVLRRALRAYHQKIKRENERVAS